MNFTDTTFWLKQVFRPKALVQYLKIVQRDKYTKSELNTINWQKRKEIVEYAYQYIPYYRECYDRENFHPSQLKSESDWERIPILEKADIRGNKPKLINPKLPMSRSRIITTGGSTGEPLQLFRDKGVNDEILKWRMLKRWSVSPGANKAMLWRIPEKSASRIAKIKNELLWWPTKRLKIDASILSDKELEGFLANILRIKPKIIWGYVGAIEQFALFLKSRNISLPFIQLTWVTAAPITKIQRELFRSVFGDAILDQYACSEIHWVASNCPCSENLHVDSDFRHVDIIDNKGHIAQIDELGDILLTDLENKVFPLIKYRVGDQSKYISNSCDCGLNYPVITPVRGRISEYLTIPNKGIINGEFLTTIFDEHYAYINQFQIHQKSDYSILVKVVPNFTHASIKDVLEKVERMLRQKTDGQVSVNIKIVDRIPADKGKIRFIKSDV